MIKPIFTILIVFLCSFNAQSQLTEISTGTTANIGEMSIDGDTLILIGHPDYFAKYSITNEDWTILTSPGISGSANRCFQVVQDNYYLLSRQLGTYDHNYILKSSDYGITWDTLLDAPGLFYTLSMADTTFGVLGGAYGCFAITDGSDTAWYLDTLSGGVFTSSTTYGDSTAILEGTSSSFLSNDREFTWQDGVNGAFGTPQKTQFLNKDTIFSLSNYGSGGGETYFRRLTFNGSTWSSLGTNTNPCTMNLPDYDCNSTVYDMLMNDDGSGHILAYVDNYLDQTNWQGQVINKAAIFYTEDHGTNWTTYITDIPQTMYNMVFLNDTIAFIGGENGLLYKWDLTVPFTSILEINQKENTSNYSVYPNPVKNFVNVFNNEKINPINFNLFSLTGELIKSGIITNDQIDLSDISSGQYILRILEEQNIFSTRITKE